MTARVHPPPHEPAAQDTAPLPTADQDSEARIRQAAMVRRMPAHLCAVLDGAHFDDLPARLAAAGLTARSLFLGNGRHDVERHGPWLVALPGPAEIDAVLDVVQGLPAAVFWSCDGGEAVLFHHLRRLNMVRLPRWAAIGKTGPEPGLAIDHDWDTVLFRHWDPRVLGDLLPVLDEGQFSRILGPASEITFTAPDHGRKRVLADPAWPLVPAGKLTIRPDQVLALQDRRLEARRRRIGNYLKEVAPNEAATYSEPDLRQLVLASEATGRDLNLRSDQGHARWAYLMLRTRGQAPQQPGLREYITDGQADPDRKITLVLSAMADAERNAPGIGGRA